MWDRLDLAIKRLRERAWIGDSRVFDDDPRFGLLVLSEIACRALSPAVNDPGTAIDVTGRLVRLFATWQECAKDNSPVKPTPSTGLSSRHWAP